MIIKNPNKQNSELKIITELLKEKGIITDAEVKAKKEKPKK